MSADETTREIHPQRRQNFIDAIRGRYDWITYEEANAIVDAVFSDKSEDEIVGMFKATYVRAKKEA